MYLKMYHSPIGDIYLNSDDEYLTALCFKNTMDYYRYIEFGEDKDLQIFDETIKWLDIYFSGKNPDFIPKYKRNDITPFRQEVIDEMLKIPYGKTVSYKDIANFIAKKRGSKTMSSQAVGGAVGWNPISIIIPCHRVVGTNKNLTGYGGGIDIKYQLLRHEGVKMDDYIIPMKGSTL